MIKAYAIFTIVLGLASTTFVFGQNLDANKSVTVPPQLEYKTMRILAGWNPFGDGYGRLASFYNPVGICSDGKFLYIADTENQIIRKLDLGTGKVTTIAGVPGLAGDRDGNGSSALFNAPYGLAYANGSLFVSDSENRIIRKIFLATGDVSTVAGIKGKSGNTDGDASTALFSTPTFLAILKNQLFIVDASNQALRVLDLETNKVTTLAGRRDEMAPLVEEGTQIPLSKLGFTSPSGIACDKTNLYVVDRTAPIIWKINLTTGMAKILAGKIGNYGCLDGLGNNATFEGPNGLSYDNGILYLADSGNHMIRTIRTDNGNVRTIAGNTGSDGGTRFNRGPIDGGFLSGNGPEARFNNPCALVCVGDKLYVSDTYNCAIRQILLSPNQYQVSTVSGSSGPYLSESGSGGSKVRFHEPSSITSDNRKTLFLSNTRDHVLLSIDALSGMVKTVAGQWGSLGLNDGENGEALFWWLGGITWCGDKLVVCDTNVAQNNEGWIRSVEISSGNVKTIAGDPNNQGTQDGVGSEASFYQPSKILWAENKIYVIDNRNSLLRQIDPVTGQVISIAGVSGTGYSGDTIIAPDLELDYFVGFCFLKGSFYITQGSSIIKLNLAARTKEVIVSSDSYSDLSSANGENVRLDQASDICTDGTNLFFIDQGGKAIRKYDLANNHIVTIVSATGTPAFWSANPGLSRNLELKSLTMIGDRIYAINGQSICVFSKD